MKKLMFLPYGKKEKTVENIERILHIRPFLLELSNGYEQDVEFINNTEIELFVTAVPTFLNLSDVWWNEKELKFEIYFYSNGKIKNIQELTEKWIRQAHNIERMFLNDAFKFKE